MSYTDSSWNLQDPPREAVHWGARLERLGECAHRAAYDEACHWLLDAPAAPDNEDQLRRIVEMVGDRPECMLGVRQVLAWYVGANPESAVARVIQARHTYRSGDQEIALAQYRSARKRDRTVSDPDLDALLAQAFAQSVVPAAKKSAPVSAPTPLPAKRSAPVPVPPKAQPEPPAAAAKPTPAKEKKRPQPIPAKKESETATDRAPDAPSETGPEAPASQETGPSSPPVSPPSEATQPETTKTEADDASTLLVVSGGEMVHALAKKPDTREKLTSVIAALVVHLVAIPILAFMIVSQPRQLPPQITAVAEYKGDENSLERAEVRRIEPASAPTVSAQAQVITSRAFSNLTLPSFDKPVTSFDPIGLGEGFGTSMSLGMGKDGGSVSFFGAKAVSKKVIFVVDFSASMTGARDELMRKELIKSVQSLPNGVQYQVICFSGPAWYAGQEVGDPGIVDGFAGNSVKAGSQKYIWFEGWDQSQRHKGDGSSALFHFAGGEANLPKAGYIIASRLTLRTTVEQIEKTPLVFGTDWRWPLMMAMNMKPDTIYFMTDGAFGTGEGVSKKQMIDSLLAYNRKNSNARINTICMMVLQAREELEQLANGTRGEFTLVESDGTVVRARDLDK